MRDISALRASPSVPTAQTDGAVVDLSDAVAALASIAGLANSAMKAGVEALQQRDLASARSDRHPLYGFSYLTDPEGLKRMRDSLLRTPDWHARAPINCNSLARLLDTIEELRQQTTKAGQ